MKFFRERVEIKRGVGEPLSHSSILLLGKQIEWLELLELGSRKLRPHLENGQEREAEGPFPRQLHETTRPALNLWLQTFIGENKTLCGQGSVGLGFLSQAAESSPNRYPVMVGFEQEG